MFQYISSKLTFNAHPPVPLLELLVEPLADPKFKAFGSNVPAPAPENQKILWQGRSNLYILLSQRGGDITHQRNYKFTSLQISMILYLLWHVTAVTKVTTHVNRSIILFTFLSILICNSDKNTLEIAVA